MYPQSTILENGAQEKCIAKLHEIKHDIFQFYLQNYS